MLIDLGCVLVLGVLALAGLGATYTGWEFLVVGTLGLVLGVVLAWLGAAYRWPLVAPVLLAVVLFYLLGGLLCLRDQGAVAPVPDTWRLLTDQGLFGWKDLLTTLPPVDGDSALLVLPWALGLLGGAVGGGLSRLSVGPPWLRAAAPVAAMTALLGLVILLGVSHPQSLLLQGVLFPLVAIGWLGLRNQRTGGALRGRAGRLSRLALGSLVLGLAALVTLPLAGLLPIADSQRVILRNEVEPPFDIGQYPSPLASFRRYVDLKDEPTPENLYNTSLFTITGVEPGTRVRFASLDRYDGVVWGAANDTIPGATNDTYRRVSSTIDNPVEGTPVEVGVTLDEGYSGVWLPVVGALQSMRFDEGDPEAKAESFRFNLAASTAVVPSGVRPGDRYSFTAVLPDDSLSPETAPSSLVGEAADAAAFLETQAQEWSSGESLPMRRMFAIAEYLHDEGRYSDGVVPSEERYHAGHYVRRLSDEFVNAPLMVGNDEQYAAVMALLANRVGVPARVVMGAVVPDGGAVTGADVSAWVEVQAADGSWRTLPTEQFMSDQQPAKLPPQSDRSLTGVNIPPPAPIPPPSTIGDQTDLELEARKSATGDSADDKLTQAIPGWVRLVAVALGGPLLAVLTLGAAVVVAKTWRRRRRRHAGRISARIVGAWRELVDHARDLGHPVPVGSVVTRREQSVAVDSTTAPQLARAADAHVFGPTSPDAETATTYWAAVDAERRALSASAGRRRRLRAAINPRTLGRRPG
jgi:Transglutaminase-like superfamily